MRVNGVLLAVDISSSSTSNMKRSADIARINKNNLNKGRGDENNHRKVYEFAPTRRKAVGSEVAVNGERRRFRLHMVSMSG